MTNFLLAANARRAFGEDELSGKRQISVRRFAAFRTLTSFLSQWKRKGVEYGTKIFCFHVALSVLRWMRSVRI